MSGTYYVDTVSTQHVSGLSLEGTFSIRYSILGSYLLSKSFSVWAFSPLCSFDPYDLFDYFCLWYVFVPFSPLAPHFWAVALFSYCPFQARYATCRLSMLPFALLSLQCFPNFIKRINKGQLKQLLSKYKSLACLVKDMNKSCISQVHIICKLCTSHDQVFRKSYAIFL